MAKVIRLSLFLITISLFLTGCSNSKEDITLDINKNENFIDSNNINQIISNDIYLKESEEQELINIIESLEKNKPTMSDEERYDLRADIFFNLNQDQVLKFGDCYTVLSQVILDGRYKALFDKENNRWDAYDNNDLYGIVNTIRYISNSVKKQAFKNDLNRIEALCLYGLENRDIIALIDARRIMRDIQYHIFEVPYFKEGDAIVEINEEDYSIYYGASEVLEGGKYKTIGIYRYN
ncbi:Uncharacterised protein [uncultured Clostridium sp.]|nr:Uncharacterised protein [uncultured Clostridium sp.]